MSNIFVVDDGCWLWRGACLPNGYATTTIDSRAGGTKRRTLYAHRVSYEAFVGPIPAEHDLDHLCRHRSCVNPRHLEPVTRRENIMRGAGVRNVAKFNGDRTHCIHGHPFDEGNTRYRPTGGRACRQCARNLKERLKTMKYQPRELPRQVAD